MERGKRSGANTVGSFGLLAIRLLDCVRAIPTAIANVQEFVNNSHRYTDSTGVRFFFETIREFTSSIWNYREYSANLELAVNVSWETVNEHLPTEYNFKKKTFEFNSKAVLLQEKVRYELAGKSAGELKFPTQTRRQLEIDRDRRDSQSLIDIYIARVEEALANTKTFRNRLFCPRAIRIVTEKAMQRLEQYRAVEHELNSIVMKHYDTTEDDFVASNKVNREIYAKLNATPGYTIGIEPTRQSFVQRVESTTTLIAMQVESYKAFEQEVGNHATLQLANRTYRGKPIMVRRLSRDMREAIDFAIVSHLTKDYGQSTTKTVLHREVRTKAATILLEVINVKVFEIRRNHFEQSIPGVHSMIGL